MDIDDKIDINIQPIFNINTLSIEYGEVLLRPINTNLSTFELLKLVRKNKATLQLDKEIIKQSCELMNSTEKQIKLSINLCAETLEIKEVHKKLTDIIDSYNIERYRIIVEINEETNFTSRVVMDNIDGLIKSGLLVALDDFGCGNTSLTNIIDYKLDVVKFDRSLIDMNWYQKRHLKGLVDILNELMVDTVIEGVETIEELEEVKKIGYKLMQGYLLCKPIEPKDFINMV